MNSRPCGGSFLPALSIIYFRRRSHGCAGFTERDWLFLFDEKLKPIPARHPREKALSLRLWLRFAALLLVVVIIGLAISFYVLPFSLGWSVSAVLLTIAGILLFVPRWL